MFSRACLFAALGTGAHQAPLSTGFFRLECWSGLPFPTPGNLPDTEIKLASLASPGLAGRCFTSLPPSKPRDFVMAAQNECAFAEMPGDGGLNSKAQRQKPFY